MFAENLWLLPSISALLGLMVGSFLNVVIHRLPVMMEMEWRRECRSFLQPEEMQEATPPYNLVIPGSHCPLCNKSICPWENIPIVSYLWLRGCCSGCGAPISLRYPLVELLAGIVSFLVAWHFGFTMQTLAALFLSWGLIALTFIDIDRQILPDAITQPLLWMGILLSLMPIFANSQASILGAVCGYLILWLVYHVFKLVTGKEGMGYGDFKLLALLGAWLGWAKLPAIILLSSLVGALWGAILIVSRRHERGMPIPYGPYLAAAGWISLLWGDELNRQYMNLVGLGE